MDALSLQDDAKKINLYLSWPPHFIRIKAALTYQIYIIATYRVTSLDVFVNFPSSFQNKISQSHENLNLLSFQIQQTKKITAFNCYLHLIDKILFKNTANLLHI